MSPSDTAAYVAGSTDFTPKSKDDIKRRIDEASQFVALDQLCLSTQCGFSSTVEGNSLTFDEEVAKLQLVREVADAVWG